METRLQECHTVHVDWSLIPSPLTNICKLYGKSYKQCPSTVLLSLLVLVSFCLGHAECEVKEKNWAEPIILWVATALPTGRCKSAFHLWITSLIERVESRVKTKVGHCRNVLLSTCTWEKFGDLLAESGGRQLGLFDELISFFATMNMYSSQKAQVSETKEYSDFLQIFTGKSKTRETVTGNANFKMSNTSFTMMGFTQPFSALPIIKDVQNNAKGFTSRILWYFPQPIFAKLRDTVLSKKEMEMQMEFEEFFVDLLSELYIAGEDSFLLKDDNKIKVVYVQRRKFRLSNDAFDTYCDIHDDWEMNVCKENPYSALLGGLFSRGKGHVLRLSVPIHILTSVVAHVFLDVTTETRHEKDNESTDSTMPHAADDDNSEEENPTSVAKSSSHQSDDYNDSEQENPGLISQSSSHQSDDDNDGEQENPGLISQSSSHQTDDNDDDSQISEPYDSDDELPEMPTMGDITYKGYKIPSQISPNAIHIAHSLVENSIKQICILHNSEPKPSTTHLPVEPEDESSSQVRTTPSKIEKNTSNSLIKSILLAPGKVVSISRLIQKGLFRNKEVDGERGKNLVCKLLNEIQDKHLATVERFTVANKSNVTFVIKHEKPEHNDDLQHFLALIHSYGIGISTYMEKLRPTINLDIQESEKHLQDYEVRKRTEYSSPNKRQRII